MDPPVTSTAELAGDASADAPPPPPMFLDVQALLERSQPRQYPKLFWYVLGVMLLAVMLSTYLGRQGRGMQIFVELMSGLVMIGLMVGMAALTYVMAARQRAEVKQLEAVEELVQLRRWPQAAVALEGLLSAPTRTPHARVQALIYLTSVLARYHRFEEAIAVQNYLLENVRMDAGTEYAIRLGRAMAMLREDHLVDADRAFGELRRMAAAGGDADAAGAEGTNGKGQGRESAGLALLEIYRDVKTGHPAEAVEIFEQRLAALRDQLGHRAADAYALAAKAYDLLGREAEAQGAYEKATLLSPPDELRRRYPEIQSLASKYRAAEAPAA